MSVDDTDLDRTDWERLRSVSDDEAIANAEGDADAQPLTDGQLDGLAPSPRVRVLRLRMGLTQEAFARRFGLHVSVLRDWEQGRSRPHRSAEVLLSVIDTDPDAVERAAKRLPEVS